MHTNAKKRSIDLSRSPGSVDPREELDLHATSAHTSVDRSGSVSSVFSGVFISELFVVASMFVSLHR